MSYRAMVLCINTLPAEGNAQYVHCILCKTDTKYVCIYTISKYIYKDIYIFFMIIYIISMLKRGLHKLLGMYTKLCLYEI